MSRMISILIAAIGLGLAGCQIDTPVGPIKIGPRTNPGPNPGVVVGQWCDEDGKCYQLVDTNGDGVPDFVYDPDKKRYYPITLPEMPDGPLVIPQGQLQAFVRMCNDPTTQVLAEIALETADLRIQEALADVIIAVSPCNPTIDWQAYFDQNPDDIIWDGGDPDALFDFQGLTAEQWAANVGLDVPSEQLITAYNFELREYDPVADVGHAFFYWWTEHEWPADVFDFEGLQHNIWGLASELPGGATFLVFELGGPMDSIYGFVAESHDFDLGDLEYTCWHESSEFHAVSDGVTFTVTQDGTVVDERSIP
jgi:hypothetical protein